MVRSLRKFITGVVLLLLSHGALSATAQYWAIVGRVIIDDTNQGGCSILTTPGPQSTGLNCANNFVSLDCVGRDKSKSIAKDMLSTAQMGMVLGKYVRIVVDDVNKHNGLCTARRMDATLLDSAP